MRHDDDLVIRIANPKRSVRFRRKSVLGMDVAIELPRLLKQFT